MRVLFYGTPPLAVPFLESVAAAHEVAAVVTRQDKPAGRGLETAVPAVKTAAGRLGLKVLQPSKPAEVLGELKAFAADVGVVVAYGRLLPVPVIEACRHGTLNIHFSLLPKYRGAAPIQWTLLNGEARTGITSFWIDAGMDTGPMFLQREIPVDPADDAAALEAKLIPLGVSALKETLESIAAGVLRRVPQSGEPSAAPPLRKEHGRLDLAADAWAVHNRIRALSGGPVAFLELKDRKGAPLRLNALRSLPPESGPPGSETAPGTIVAIERGRGILVQCGVGRIWLQRVQPEGRKPMDGADFSNGFRLKAGDSL